MNARRQYNLKNNNICYLRKPSSAWIRRANELLQAHFDHGKIWFGARAVDDAYQIQRKKKIPIKGLRFLPVMGNEKQSDAARMIDLVEHQSDLIDLAKTQCALIQITTSPQGTQTFDLPSNLKKQTGPDKARKDSYSALVLGNWMIETYFDMMEVDMENWGTTFVPQFVN